MANNDDNFVQKLIAESRQLAQVNARKRESEETLRELTMFRNFCSVIQPDSLACDKVFDVSVKVVPSGVASCSGSLSHSPHEIAVVNVHNKSDSFMFNPKYWQFLVGFEGGESISAFSNERTLLPGASETFCTAFSTDCSITPVQINVKLVFSLKFKNKHFVKTVNLKKLLVDLLHLLNPGRISLSEMYDSSLSSSDSASFSHIYHDVSKDQNKALPAVTQFFLHFDSEMLRHFMHHVILNDSFARGLKPDVIQDLDSLTPSLRVYYQAEEIDISSKPKGPGVIVSFKSSNSKVLFALRIAILRRLVQMPNVKVNCSDDKISEKLYDLKLRVEDLGRVDTSDIEIADFMDVYLELRDISEMIQFILLKDVD